MRMRNRGNCMNGIDAGLVALNALADAYDKHLGKLANTIANTIQPLPKLAN